MDAKYYADYGRRVDDYLDRSCQDGSEDTSDEVMYVKIYKEFISDVNKRIEKLKELGVLIDED